MAENFDANVASPAQVAERLRQLGIRPDSITTNAQPMAAVSQDRQLQLLEQRNEQRKLARAERQRAYAARIDQAVAAQRPPLDARTATAEQAHQRLAAMGLSLAGLEPLRDPRPAAQLLADPQGKARTEDSAIDTQAEALLDLSRRGVPIDARAIDGRIFRRYLALKHSPSEWQVL